MTSLSAWRQALKTGAGSVSSGRSNSATTAASLSVTSRLAFTAGFQSGSSGRPTALAAAAINSSSESGWSAMVVGPRSDRRMRNRRQQLARIARLRCDHDALGRTMFDNLSSLHDDDTIAQKPHHVEVVRDKKVAHPQR